ncbi:glycosyltransferase [uncultured Psychroserpens sp.]|uniref:glycosyltransferase n=1 Tax=uncultured Psychroserpens sp. TaxID=255436 RepID=UPI00261387B9|nr:glycosyltransferase [uncultured Psychroserpens sp.]
MKLAIISHTEHYKDANGSIVGWSPTVNEINHLTRIFDEIYHVAMFIEGEAPPSVMSYNSDKIKFVPIPKVGGKTLFSKLNVIVNAPKIINTVSKTLKKVDYFQLRTPTGIGVFLIPYLTYVSKKPGWFKYAGNWNQSNPPLGYKLQRSQLKKQSRPVTINGQWDAQPPHCLTFENPCLNEENIEEGNRISETKRIAEKVSFCYVGRLEREKGVERIINAFRSLNETAKTRVDKVHLVGDGFELDYFKTIAKDSGVNIVFHGYLAQQQVFDIYRKSHVFLMPTTASEGFPKVIAEAMNFRCIPVVSSVSSISQYVLHKKNGYILPNVSNASIVSALEYILTLSDSEYVELISSIKSVVTKFTFKHYNHRIINDIINNIS